MLDPKAAKMEAALLGGLIRAIVPKLISLGQEKYKLHKSVKSDIEFLIMELRMILGTIEASEQGDGHEAVSSLWIENLRELAFGIEDFLDGLTYHAIWKKQPSSFRKIFELPKMLRTRLESAGERKKLRNKSTEIYEQMKRYKDLAGGGPQSSSSSSAPMDESPSQVFHPRNILRKKLFGVDGLQAELLEQLAEATGQLKVIAIVGFCGLGKTAVAAQVYNRETDAGRFEKNAWVCAAGRRPTEVLADVLSELTADAGCSSQGTSTKDRQLCEDIRKQLHNKRYLIVIDDIQTQDMWRNIKSAFPDNSAVSSRILVTTTIQSVANACSSTGNYVHKMRRLDKGCSKQLFSTACPNSNNSCHEHKDSEAILKKCGGQPLALVTIGEFLQTKGWPTDRSCKDICNKLHYYLKIDTTFEEMRRVLIRNYTSLPDHALKACLLYFGMFPIDYQIKRKSLYRLWLAEGFVDLNPSNSTPDAATAFDVLKDRNIIERVYVSNNENVKTTCQTYSMMHEVILHMPISKNFVTLLCDETTKTKFVRRLSLHKNADTHETNLDTEALSLIRSLMVFGKTSEAVLDFKNYRLLRVLDLEKCDYLEDKHVKEICCLLLLKYLSLGKNVTKLPKDISKLTVLDTLDLRGSAVAELRAAVFQMPSLVHLFGKFKIPVAMDFPSHGRSVLQTLAGFIADREQGYLNLMDYMIKLRNVKVWCEPTAGGGNTNWTDLQKAIQKFIQDKNEANNGDRSLSLHFDNSFKDYLYSLNEPCYLSSLKLYGELDALPEFVISLSGLKELCLSYVKFKADLLEALTLLSNLEYLKLIADDLEKFTIKEGAFPKLVRLCFVLKHPTFPTIEKGSMEQLKTLQLLCKDLHGLCGITIEYLGNLKEVILDDRVHPDTWGQWEKAAKKHTKKPKVFPFKTAESSKREAEAEISKEKHTEDRDTSMPVNEGSESYAEQKTHDNCAFQSTSDDKSNSSFSHTGVLEVPPLTKLSDLTTVYSANNSISTDETIAHTHTQIAISEKLGSSDELKRQHRSADVHNHASKSTEVSEDSISTELSITGLFSGLRIGHVSGPYSKGKATYQG